MKKAVVISLAFLALGLMASPVCCQINSTGDLQERFQDAVGNWLGFFEDNVSWISASILDFLKHLIKATYFTIGVLGFVLWAFGISRFSGKRLLLGAVALAFVSEVLL